MTSLLCPAMTEHPGLTFVTALYRCRELGAALERFASAGTLYNVRRSLAAGSPSSSRSIAQPQVDDVCQGTAVVAKLVLKELDAAEHEFTCGPTEEGVQVVQQLQAAVFGEASLQRGFTECVYLASLAQAAQALELVTAALLDVVSTHNCFSLFNVAAACGCAPLRRKAAALALSAFPQALQNDVNGLLIMQEGHLMQLLCSDRLQVASELDSFRALAAWTEYDVAARKPRFAARMARCVRLGSIGMADLYALDAHPLVVSDRMATMLVAQLYMHMVMGLPVDNPLGLPTIQRPRHCQRGDAEASEQAAAAAAAVRSSSSPEAAADVAAVLCGLTEHAGQHGSVFEAVVCAFARHRRQRQDAEAEEAAAADLRRLSVGQLPAAQEAPGSPARTASGSLLEEVPTPSNPASSAAAPALQPTARVRHLGVPTRVGSRRTLFDMAGGSSEEEQAAGCPSSGAAAQLAQGSKSAATAEPAAEVAAAAAAAAAPRGGGSMLAGGVNLEMLMSPNHASLRGMAQQAAAAAAAQANPAGWESRKRLRF